MSVPAAALLASPSSPCSCSAPLWWQLLHSGHPIIPLEARTPSSPRCLQMTPKVTSLNFRQEKTYCIENLNCAGLNSGSYILKLVL